MNSAPASRRECEHRVEQLRGTGDQRLALGGGGGVGLLAVLVGGDGIDGGFGLLHLGRGQPVRVRVGLRLLGGEGSDTLSGGAGADTFVFRQNSDAPDTENLITDWDAGDVIVHLFRPEVRSFYNLERMWSFGDAPPPAAEPAAH